VASATFQNPGRADLVSGRWYMQTGFALPSDIGTTPPSPSMGGLYDCATGQRVADATDYKWVATSVAADHRAFVFNAASTATADFCWPRLEVCDGREPSIDALLAMAKTGLTNNLQPDFESQFGLNGQFSNWLHGAALPDGWSNAGDTNSRETSITRTGPNAVRAVSPGGAQAGIFKTVDFGGFALAEGSFIEGTLDAYLVSHSSGGYPGLRLLLYTDSGLSTSQARFFDLPNTATGGWQTIPFKAAVNAGERIYGVRFSLYSSQTGLSGGHGVNTVVFDSLLARAMQPSGTGHVNPTVLGESITGTSSSTTITERIHVPDGFSFNDIVCSTSSFTAKDTGVATVVFTATLGISGGSDGAQFSIQDANGTYSGDLPAVGGASGGSVVMAQTRQFTLAAGVSYQFKAYAAQGGVPGSPATLSVNAAVLSVSVRYLQS